MSRNSVRLLVVSVLILSVFSFPQMIPKAHAQLTGVVCIAPDLPGQTACPASPVALVGPVTTGPTTQIRLQVLIQGTDPMNGFDVTLLAPHAFLVPVGVDLTGSIISTPTITPIVLAECLQGVLKGGSVCNTSDTIDTLHLAAVAAAGALPQGTVGGSGLLFTAIYQVVGAAPAGTVISYQSDANDGLTNCANLSVLPNTCINISNGTRIPVPETAQTGTFTGDTTQPFLQLSPISTNIGNTFPGLAIPAQTLTTTDNGGYGASQNCAGCVPVADAVISYTISITPPTGTATGLTASITPASNDFSLQSAGGSLPASVSFVNGLATTNGLWVINVTGTYHFDPTCVTLSCTGPASTLTEVVGYSVNIEDFGYTVAGSTSSVQLPFWCPAANQGTACPAGQSGVAPISVTSKGYTGVVALTNGAIAPASTTPLLATLSATSIPGASGTATDTFSAGMLRPITAAGVISGQYSISVTGTGTLPASGVFLTTQTKARTVSLIVRPQNFNITTSNGTPVGPSISFASGSSTTNTLTIGSLPSGPAAASGAGFAGPVTLSSTITGGSGLTVVPTSTTVNLLAGQKLTDLVTFSGTAATTTTFGVTITGTATLATSNPTTNTQSATYSVTITVASVTHPTSTSVSCATPVVINQASTCNVTVTDTSATGATTPTGTVNLSESGVTGSFTTCTLTGTTASATCTSTFTVSTAGTAAVTVTYPGVLNQFATSSGTTSILVSPRATTTTVTCTTPVSTNQGSTCTITVADSSPGTFITPTGTVGLSQTGVTGSFTTCTLSGTTASATCASTFTASTAGTAAVTASYPGDTVHSLSSGTTSIIVNAAIDPTTTGITCNTPIIINQGSICTVTVTDTAATGATTPTGTVAITQTGVSGSFTTCTLTGTTASATCTSTFTASTSGTAAVTASYPGDTTHASSTGTASIVVNRRTTTTTVSCTTPVVINQGLTCSVTVTDNAAGTFITPTGTVALSQTGVTGSFTICTLAGTTASATCTSTFTASASGTAAVTSSYPGDLAHSSSSGTASIVVNPRATSTTASCTTPVVINQGSTCNVTVTDTSPGTAITPSGIVALSQTGVTGSFTTCTLAGTTASATCTSSFTPTTGGTAAVTANYPGDTTHAGSSGTTSVSVTTGRSTSTTVSCTTPVPVGQTSACTVTVTDTAAGTAITPTGIVALSETGVTGAFTTCTLSGTTASATCTSTFSPTTTGTAAITATYPGDANHAGSSGTTSVVVNPHTTTTTVSCTTPVVINQGSTCNVTVTDSSVGATTPTGTVALSQTGVTGSFATCTLAGTTASATCASTFTASTSGTAAVTASYPGDTTHGTSSGTASIVVNQRTTTTTVSCITPVVVNQGSICTVTVTDNAAGTFITPTGTVALGQTGVTGSFTTCTLAGTTASATCSSTFTGSSSGTAAVTASYPGDTGHSSSIGTTNVIVTVRATTTTVSCTTPINVNTGSTCNVTVTDASAGAFITPTGAVVLSETGVTGSFTTCTLVGTAASATCTSTFTPTTSGTAAVTASYPGDSTHSSSSGTTSVVVSQGIHNTTTTVSCLSPVVVFQGSTCTITVTDTSATGATTPTGTVTLTQNGVTGSFTTCTLAGTTASATCTSTFTATSSGTVSVIATYSGDTSHGGSQGTTSIVVNPRTTTTTISCTSPVVINIDSTCTVSVTDTSSGTFISPTGAIALTETTVSGSFTACILSGTTATATCTSTFTATTAGAVVPTANYPGDTSHSSSIGTGSILVNPRATSTTISCTTPVLVNQGSTCNVTVTDTSPGTFVAPNGTLTLSESGVIGTFTTCKLAGTAASTTCVSTFIATTSGTAAVSANYPGDISHATSLGTTSIVVNPRATTTTITCSTPVNIGQGSTCNVSVVDTSTAGTFLTPTGTVALSETGVTGTFTTCVLSGTIASATCTSTFTATTGGTASISANYPGDSAHSSSSGTASVVVNTPAATTSTSVSCTSPVVVNQGSTCTVTVTSTSATTPTGTVSLTETGVTGTFTTCTIAGTTASATCSSTFTATTSGTAAVTAAYLGDTTHAGSTGTASITINPRATSTTVTCTSPVNTGQGSSCTVTVTDTSTAGTFLTPTGTMGLTETGVTGSFTMCTLAGTTAVATCTSTFTASTSGTAAVTASYPGDSAHSSSSGTASITVNVVVGVPTVTVNNPTPNPANTGATVTVTFTVSSTVTVTGITVNWGDGTTADSLAGTAVSDTHVYASTGSAMSMTFTITVTATNSAGPGSGTTTEVVNDRPPVASFTLTPASPTAGQTVNFDATASADPDGTIVTYAWNFGDGTTGTGATTSHTYNPTSTTSFNVILTVTDNSGSTGSISQSITVTVVVVVNPPVVTISNITPNPANTGQMVTVTFTVSSTVAVTGITVNWGDGTINTLAGTAVTNTHSYITANTFTVTVTATNSAGPGSATTQETVTPVAGHPVLLTFQGFDIDDFDNGVGQLQVFVNGHLAVNVPTGTGTGDFTPNTNKWVNFGPFDITSFVVQGQNTIVFMTPPPGHFGLIKNVTITQGTVLLLHVDGARFVSLSHPVTFTFSIPPLVITSFSTSNTTPNVGDNVTFTATFTGGTAPFRCVFLFGDEEAVSVSGAAGHCSVTHDYDDSGRFTARVIVIGSSTSDRVSSSLKVTVADPNSNPLSSQLPLIPEANSQDDD